ncbi:type II toxin-antitoxin system RelE/ParE family toxin [Nitrospirillum viridazoti]|uniref:Plasmid stabilization protein n=1 Tax=Nitrospirillum viridazoti CBAmc TaxID=1441467 RepID=A0A248JMH8_9PROT|nr:type II toxin-antitoxin system RelE/ParE family toxin [Nitrospirillum amazonense]ASG19917.1 plasmid stabilization protein [Nitrospirillum amazonense CBAmc]
MIPIYQSPAVARDLEEIWLSIAIDNPAAATRVLRAIGVRIGRLATFPRMGVRRPDIRPSARVLVEGAYLILFETYPDTNDGPVERVDIVRVIDGRRDLPALLTDPPGG